MREYIYHHHYAAIKAIAYWAIAAEKPNGEIDLSKFLLDFPVFGRSALSDLGIQLPDQTTLLLSEEEWKKVLRKNQHLIKKSPEAGNFVWSIRYVTYRPTRYKHLHLPEEVKEVERRGYKIKPPIEIVESLEDRHWFSWDLTPEIPAPYQEVYEKW